MKRLLLALSLFSLLSGCGGGSSSPGSTSPLIGTWRSTSIQINNQTAQPCPTTQIFDNATYDCTANDTTTFNANGTFSDSGGVNGTWTLNNGILTLTTAQSRAGEVTFVGNSMTLLIIARNNIDTARLAFVKQ